MSKFKQQHNLQLDKSVLEDNFFLFSKKWKWNLRRQGDIKFWHFIITCKGSALGGFSSNKFWMCKTWRENTLSIYLKRAINQNASLVTECNTSLIKKTSLMIFLPFMLRWRVATLKLLCNQIVAVIYATKYKNRKYFTAIMNN